MRDGRTQKIKKAASSETLQGFLTRYRAKIIIISGKASGHEIPLDRERLTFGRGPAVDVAFDDAAMSRQHAAVEYEGGRFRIRDLGSTNGLAVNDRQVQAADLDHGDRFEVGSVSFQLVIEESDPVVEAYELSVDA